MHKSMLSLVGLLSLAVLLPDTARAEFDADKAAAFGIRKVAGQHITLYTDLPVSPAIAELPQVFDRAVPQWHAYFKGNRVDSFKITAYLMRDANKFQQCGAFPNNLPDFKSGYQIGDQIWFREQPSDYYRRHLLLHEGTHAFMFWRYGVDGPPWYIEGLAEYFGTHQWRDGRLITGVFPTDRNDVPHWGRVRILREARENGRAKTLIDIMNYDRTAHLRDEPYGWCWAATVFFRNHPRTRALFDGLKDEELSDTRSFNRAFYARLRPQWNDLAEDWQLFVLNADYGYNITKGVVQRRTVTRLPATGSVFNLSAQHGWQSTGIHLEAGSKYQITATGKFQIAKKDKPWICEANGVTIRYHQGKPIGLLMGAIRNDRRPPTGLSPLARPSSIGPQRTITPQSSGTLYLMINESTGELHDNEGGLQIQIRKI